MPGLAPYVQTLAANGRVNIEARGTTVFLRQATGEVKVSLRSRQVGPRTGVAYTVRMNQAEQWLHAEEFDSVEVEDVSGNANSIELYIGYGRFIKPVPDIVNVQVTSAESETVVSTTDVTTIGIGNANKVQILAADADRVFAVLVALSGNGDNIRLADTNVGIARGIQLQPGDSYKWTSKAACFACAELVANQGVSIVEFKVS